MKNFTILLAAIAFFAISCKKDYTCTCTLTSAGSTVSNSTVINGTKKDAKETCENGSSNTLGIVTTCSIN